MKKDNEDTVEVKNTKALRVVITEELYDILESSLPGDGTVSIKVREKLYEDYGMISPETKALNDKKAKKEQRIRARIEELQARL